MTTLYSLTTKHFIVLFVFSFFFSVSVKSQVFNQASKLVASDRGLADLFGNRVSISGQYAVAASFREDSNADGEEEMQDAGSAYVYERSSSDGWIQVAKLVANDREMFDNFGVSIAIDGDYIMAGTTIESSDENGNNEIQGAGSVYVFKRSDEGVWSQSQKIVASDRAQSDQFGCSVAMSGTYAIIGAQREDENDGGTNPLEAAGSAYIFERDQFGFYIEKQKIVPIDRELNDWFGAAVGIGGDYAIVGARNELHDANGENELEFAGSAYIFERSPEGVWGEANKVVASDRAGGDIFGGWSVDISGEYAIVGAEKQDNGPGGFIMDSGAAYIFKRGDDGDWTEYQKLSASDRDINDWFGHAVAIDDGYAIVGAYSEDEDENDANSMGAAGSAYIYKLNDLNVWNEISKVVASDREIGANLGRSVSISETYVICGAWSEDKDAAGENPLSAAGAAYIYEMANPNSTIGREREFGLSIYPNPAESAIRITWDLEGDFTFTTRDITGRTVNVQSVNASNSSEIDLSDLNQGTYLIEMRGRDGYEVRRFVKL